MTGVRVGRGDLGTGRPSEDPDGGSDEATTREPQGLWPHQERERGLEQILPRSLQEGSALPDLDLRLLAFLGGQSHPPRTGGEGGFQH